MSNVYQAPEENNRHQSNKGSNKDTNNHSRKNVNKMVRHKDILKRMDSLRIDDFSLCDYLKLNVFCCCHFHNAKTRYKSIIKFYDLIEFKFDIVNFIKLQNEFMLLKSVLLSKQQNNIISIISKLNYRDNEVNVLILFKTIEITI